MKFMNIEFGEWKKGDYGDWRLEGELIVIHLLIYITPKSVKLFNPWFSRDLYYLNKIYKESKYNKIFTVNDSDAAKENIEHFLNKIDKLLYFM